MPVSQSCGNALTYQVTFKTPSTLSPSLHRFSFQLIGLVSYRISGEIFFNQPLSISHLFLPSLAFLRDSFPGVVPIMVCIRLKHLLQRNAHATEVLTPLLLEWSGQYWDDKTRATAEPSKRFKKKKKIPHQTRRPRFIFKSCLARTLWPKIKYQARKHESFFITTKERHWGASINKTWLCGKPRLCNWLSLGCPFIYISWRVYCLIWVMSMNMRAAH